MKKLITILFALNLINYAFSQTIYGEFTAHYRGTMQLGDNNIKNEDFTFIFGHNSSYFASDTNYQFENTGDFGIGSYFPERFLYINNTYSVSGQYVQTLIAYDENTKFDWKIQDRKKLINGVNCQLATARKFGRNWSAYFAKEYPFPFGPVKFGGLPGLVFEVSDSTGQYKFVIEDLKKENIVLKLNLNNYKKLSKSNYLKARENSEFSIASFPGMPVQQTKEFEKKLEKLRQMNNNPLELKPFE
ncbi:GLPGLI family protein [uncultured Chryseobacterium sp.]|uniref:GLPGLI family protein n=1 Tax=uncultured Chryseobacterium sp. TaxID=259322 RepID=UPI0025E00CAD|nr:GLPGLI family protein [uncultured Chryseobacterium sp.]